MTETGHPALLPEGLHDVLPPDAAHEAAQVERLMAMFSAWGYERIKPPLIEFEDSLLAGAGAAMAGQTFRLLDPVSQRMLAVRADTTLQAARIATTRLIHEPRPLRLAYAGQVLRVKGGQLRRERQFGQVGVELIGPLDSSADAEVIVLGAHALTQLGVNGISVDLCVPTLVPALCRSLALSEEDLRRLRLALDRKDAAAVMSVGGPAAETLARLLAASGPAPQALAALADLTLEGEAAADRQRLTEVVGLIGTAAKHLAPDLKVTVDLVEYRGFEYQSGLSFTFFARDVRGELGVGGRYRAGCGGAGGDPRGEPGTGFTFYTDTVLRAVPGPRPQQRLYIPQACPPERAAQARADGWTTVAGLRVVEDETAEARRLRCRQRLGPDGPVAVPN
ncbi:ATP phosphoribosyltransferase regulatory subunit [uncultured Gammaproteobacteria bacterium]